LSTSRFTKEQQFNAFEANFLHKLGPTTEVFPNGINISIKKTWGNLAMHGEVTHPRPADKRTDKNPAQSVPRVTGSTACTVTKVDDTLTIFWRPFPAPVVWCQKPWHT